MKRMKAMEVRTVEGAAIAAERGILPGAEHDALVAEADALLSVGRAREAADAVTKLRVHFPDSAQTLRLTDRLRVVSEADAYWRHHSGSDFLSLFGQASAGAFIVGGGVVALGLGFLFTLFGGKATLMGEIASGAFQLILGALLTWLGWRALRRGQGRA
jgi:hypothetical protein